MRHALIATFTIATAVFGVACDERLSDFTGPTPDLRPTFSSIQRDIFTASDSSGRPACTRCHTDVGRNPAGGMALSGSGAYGNLVNVASRAKPGAIHVIPGDPAHSYIIHKVAGDGDIAGARMPQGGPYLTEGQIAIIKRWIELGAPNN